jgi:trehalose 6-phosphate phosphatase
LQEPTPRVEQRLPPSMEALARDAGNSALFLDCDGTLLDIALSPDTVTVPAGLVELLVRVSKRLDGALAILSGRQLAEIDNLLAPAMLIGAGVHGGELRTTPGGPITQVATSLPNSLIERVADVSRRMPGIIAEPKGPGLAVHYRLAPDMKAADHPQRIRRRPRLVPGTQAVRDHP